MTDTPASDSASATPASNDPTAVVLSTKWVDVEEELSNLQFLPPIWVMWALVLFSILALIPIGLIVKSRFSRSNIPRIHIIQDMDAQPKFKAQRGSTLFADGRATRRQVAGSVAWPSIGAPKPAPFDTRPGDRTMPDDSPELGDDDHYFRGAIVTGDGATWADVIPAGVPVTDELMNRGERRYNIFCAPCHGVDGEGRGLVTIRAEQRDEAFTAPANLTESPVRDRPLGHLFNTITNGTLNMKGYGHMIPVDDRWAIVAWVKALQRHTRTFHDDMGKIDTEGRASDANALNGLRRARPE